MINVPKIHKQWTLLVPSIPLHRNSETRKAPGQYTATLNRRTSIIHKELRTLKNLNLKTEDLLASLDVKSWYPNVPFQKTLDEIAKKITFESHKQTGGSLLKKLYFDSTDNFTDK